MISETTDAIVDLPIAHLREALRDEGEERLRAAYPGATWDRLAKVKARYDADNVFRLNQNVPPQTPR